MNDLSHSVPNERQVSAFAEQTVEAAMVEMKVRRGKLEPFIREAEDLDFAIREVEKVVAKVRDRKAKRERPISTPSGRATGRNTMGAKKDQVRELIANGEVWTPSQVAEEGGMTAAYASLILGEMTDAGELTKLERGKYRRATNGSQPSADPEPAAAA